MLTVMLYFYYLFCLLQLAQANFSNTSRTLVGDKAAGMGGAGVALVGDISSMAYYNPATLAQVDAEAFSASVGVYKKYDTLYGKVEDFTRAPFRVNKGFFDSLPSSTGSVLSWRQFKLALSIIVPSYDHFRGDIRSTEDGGLTRLDFSDQSLWVGGAASMKLDETSSLGGGFYYTARNSLYSIEDRSPTRLYSETTTVVQNALVLQLGYYRALSDQLKFGTTARLAGLPIHSKGAYFSTDFSTNGGISSAILKDETDLDVGNQIAPELLLGFSFKPSGSSLELAAQVQFQGAFQSKRFEGTEFYQNQVHKAIANAHFGIQYQYSENLRIRSGVFSNLAPQPVLNINNLDQRTDRVDMVGFSANMEIMTKSRIAYTFGGYYQGGLGKSIQRMDHTYQVMPRQSQIFTMLIGTSYLF